MERVGLNSTCPACASPNRPTLRARASTTSGTDRHVAGGNAEDVARRTDPDRAKVVAGRTG